MAVNGTGTGWRSAALLGLFLVVHTPGTAQSDPVPPPANQVAANCDRPVYATDKLVCTSEQLRALDQDLLRLWVGVRDFSWVAGFWIEPQDGWFRRRSLCAFASDHAACAEAAYTERISVLYLLKFPPRSHGPTISCSGDGGFAEGTAYNVNKAFLLSDKAGQPRVVAMTEVTEEWTPYARVHVAGYDVWISRIDGATLHCTMSGKSP